MIVKILLIACLMLAMIPIRNKKTEAFATSIIFGVMICIFSLNNSSLDQYAYSILYEDHSYFSVESGYIALITLSAKLGFNYIQFKALIMLAAFILLHSRIKNYKHINIRKVLLLWGFTSFWFDIEQSRYMIAACIVIFATKYLETWRIGNFIKFVLLILLAFTIHTTMIVFLSLTLVYCNKKFLNVVAVVSCIVTGLFVFMGGEIEIIGQLIYKVIPNKRILMWFSFHTHWGWLGPVSVQFFIFGTLWYWRRTLSKGRGAVGLSPNETSFLTSVYKIFLVSFLFMPMYVVSTEFLRLIRGLLLLYFSCVSIYYAHANARGRSFIVLASVVFIVLFNVQGLNGILFYNDYFVEYMILQNDINSTHYWILLLSIVSVVVYVITTFHRKLRLSPCKTDFEKT